MKQLEITKKFILECLPEYFEEWDKYDPDMSKNVRKITDDEENLEAFVRIVNIAYEASIEAYERWFDVDKQLAKKEIVRLLFEKGIFDIEYSEKVLNL